MSFRLIWVVAAVCLLALPSRAAFVSEIDLGGPAGRAVELSGLDPAKAHSLLVVDANSFAPAAFGVVLGVAHLPAGLTSDAVVMVSESAWPGEPTRTTPLATLATAPAQVDLNFTRLLVVMEGQSAALPFDRPMTDPQAAARYDASAVTDWVVLGGAQAGSQYQGNGHDLGAINTTLGIDLLAHLADRDAGRVIGRANRPGQPIDMAEFFAGDPDALGQFQADALYNYTYTPGDANPVLSPINPIPEPGTLGCLAITGLGLIFRRRHPAAC